MSVLTLEIIKEYHHTYLALGSNLGNKFEYLQYAVGSIFEEVGSIVKISPVYQSPAMGFDGNDFLNCVVQVETHLTAHQVLTSILRIEKKLGRKRKIKEEYSSRPIDIDILFYNNACIETKTLSVPHPEISKRRFVLQPLCDIASGFLHPVRKKTIRQLLKETEDKSTLIKQSKWLRNPKKDYSLSHFKYIAIEGNIGAGKTSLATQIAHDFNAKLILERFNDNPFLPKFYQDPSRYAFPLEMSFLADRYQQLLDDIKQHDLFTDYVIADYDAYKSMIFANITLQEEEFALYKKLFFLMHKDLPKPDLYIYLYQNTPRLLENIKKRGREFETGIEATYLQKINQGYLDFIKTQHGMNIKMIDISDRDFVSNRKDYLWVLQEIIASTPEK